MREWHPAEHELAALSSECNGGGVLEHVRSCARCRSMVADHDWLRRQLTETLVSVVTDIPVPRSAWWNVQDGVVESRRRQSLRIQISAVVTVVMVLSLLLCVPGFVRSATAAQASQPEVPLRPTPVVVTQPTGVGSGSMSSETSAVFTSPRPASESLQVPAVAPLPTPPDPE